jgi:hypothetical protein
MYAKQKKKTGNQQMMLSIKTVISMTKSTINHCNPATVGSDLLETLLRNFPAKIMCGWIGVADEKN